MSATADLSPDAVITPRLRDRWRANRGLVLVGVLLLVGALLLALAQSSRNRGLLDPQATDPSGSAALATLLTDQGVRVVRVTDTASAVRELEAAGARATLVVAPTAPLSERMLDAIAAAPASHRVLLAPDDSTLAALADWASLGPVRVSTDEIDAGCSWDIATRAGPLPATGPTYSTERAGAWLCWEGSVLDLPSSGAGDGDGTPTTVVGGVAALTNDKLDESGNASMALGVLGRSEILVWWLPSSRDPLQFAEAAEVTFSDLVPSWVGWALLQVCVATLVLVWWRARRLGRIVVEPLPVVVRATESVEGRARLYRRGRARGHAADALRAAAATRLRSLLSLPRGADLTTVVTATAERTGRSDSDVAALLAPGIDPTDDAGLTRLAYALDSLENEVRHT